MLQLVEIRAEKVAAQKKMAELIGRAWSEREKRLIVWRPDSMELEIAHEGRLWFASHKAGADGGTYRYWNSFGEYARTGNLGISVEINIPIDTNDARVSGFFAKDPETGVVYLMHDGGLGGGKKGVGKEAFLAWSGLNPIPVAAKDGSRRFGLIVTPLDQGSVDASLTSFVNRAVAFKSAVRSGEIGQTAGDSFGASSYRDYFKEFSGKKAGERRREFEYESRHGDIVDALFAWTSGDHTSGRMVKNAYIDLGVEVGGQLTTLFEVKTSLDRQCMYTGIGQLAVHGFGPEIKRFLVIPDGNDVPADIASSLVRLGIGVIRFSLSGRRVSLRAV